MNEVNRSYASQFSIVPDILTKKHKPISLETFFNLKEYKTELNKELQSIKVKTLETAASNGVDSTAFLFLRLEDHGSKALSLKHHTAFFLYV